MFEMTFTFHDHLGHDLGLILNPKNVRFRSWKPMKFSLWTVAMEKCLATEGPWKNFLQLFSWAHEIYLMHYHPSQMAYHSQNETCSIYIYNRFLKASLLTILGSFHVFEPPRMVKLVCKRKIKICQRQSWSFQASWGIWSEVRQPQRQS